jgi:cyclic nucleotide-binding protein
VKLAELEKRLKTEPDNLGLRIMVAGALREAGRQAEAVELYRSVAIAYRDQGRTQQAIACCRSILEIAPDDQRCLALLAALVAGHKARLPGAPQTGPQPIAHGSSADRRMPHAEVGTPPPPPPRPEPEEPRRRSSLDETPLPQALPHHIHDPTTKSLKRLSMSDLEADPPASPLTTTTSTDVDDDDDLPVAEGAQTRPGSEPGARPSSSVVGIANAARRISASLTGSLDSEYESMDLAAELDTRQRPRIESRDIAKISAPPPTVPIERLTPDPGVPDPEAPDEDAVTQLPSEPTLERIPAARDSGSEEEQTRPRELPVGTRPMAPVQPLVASAFFRPLPSDRRNDVLTRFQRRSVSGGTTVIRQGETGHALIVVARGKLELRCERPDGKLVVVGTIASGDYVGEAALLARAPAAAHIVAATDAELLLLAPRDFYEIAGAFPALWAELKRVAERRVREHAAKLG